MKKVMAFLFVTILVFPLVSCKSEKAKETPADDNSFQGNDISSIVSYPFYEVTSPVHSDLTIEDFKQVYTGVPFEEVIKIIGAPHEHQNSYSKHIYKVSNGKEVIIEYENGVVKYINFPYYPVKSPIYKDLTMKEVDELYIGMPYEASLEIMGAAHRYFGDSALRHLYDLNDGTIISIIYTRGAISRIIVQKPNGEKSETVS